MTVRWATRSGALQLIKPRIKVKLGLTQEAGWRGASHAHAECRFACGCVIRVPAQTDQKKPQNQEKAWRYPLTRQIMIIILRCACATWCENRRNCSSCLHPLIKGMGMYWISHTRHEFILINIPGACTCALMESKLRKCFGVVTSVNLCSFWAYL